MAFGRPPPPLAATHPPASALRLRSFGGGGEVALPFVATSVADRRPAHRPSTAESELQIVAEGHPGRLQAHWAMAERCRSIVCGQFESWVEPGPGQGSGQKRRIEHLTFDEGLSCRDTGSQPALSAVTRVEERPSVCPSAALASRQGTAPKRRQDPQVNGPLRTVGHRANRFCRASVAPTSHDLQRMRLRKWSPHSPSQRKRSSCSGSLPRHTQRSSARNPSSTAPSPSRAHPRKPRADEPRFLKACRCPATRAPGARQPGASIARWASAHARARKCDASLCRAHMRRRAMRSRKEKRCVCVCVCHTDEPAAARHTPLARRTLQEVCGERGASAPSRRTSRACAMASWPSTSVPRMAATVSPPRSAREATRPRARSRPSLRHGCASRPATPQSGGVGWRGLRDRAARLRRGLSCVARVRSKGCLPRCSLGSRLQGVFVLVRSLLRARQLVRWGLHRKILVPHQIVGLGLQQVAEAQHRP